MFSISPLSQWSFSGVQMRAGGGVTYTITAAQLSALQVNNAADATILAAIAGTTPPPTDVQVPRDGPSLTDATGGVWTIGSTTNPLYGNAILRNGVQVSPQQPAWGVLIEFTNGRLTHVNALGQRFLWNGNLAGIVWSVTTAP